MKLLAWSLGVVLFGLVGCGAPAEQAQSENELVAQCVATAATGAVTSCGCVDPLTGTPVTCKPMIYDVCKPGGTGKVVVNPIAVVYGGPTPAVAQYTCGTPVCKITGSTTAATFDATGLGFVAEFSTTGKLLVYPVPVGATLVSSPSRAILFPLLPAGAAFANPAAAVNFTYNSTSYHLFLDYQNDCFPGPGGECTCTTC